MFFNSKRKSKKITMPHSILNTYHSCGGKYFKSDSLFTKKNVSNVEE